MGVISEGGEGSPGVVKMGRQASNLQTHQHHWRPLMENEQLETLLVAQVLTLAKVMEAAGSTYKSDHYLSDAIREIRQQRVSILQRLAQTQ
jgi:hypothetical protein